MNEASLPRWARLGLRSIRRATAVRRINTPAAGMVDGPDFICIGGQRCGTQWLYDQLEPHPDFWMPPFKELHYFDGRFPETSQTARSRYELRSNSRAKRGLADRDRSFFDAAARVGRQRIDADLYAELFAGKGGLITGDITPCYSILTEREIDRIAARFPKLKVVLLLRDPVDRFWSQVCLEARRGTVPHLDPADHRKVLALAREKRFRGRSLLSEISRRWKARVPEHSFRIFFLDDIAARPDLARAEILRFLGADPLKESGQRPPEHNPKAARAKLILPPETHRRLVEFFAQELAACAAQFGGPAKLWAERHRR
jgi:hypothetical protein